VDLLVDIGNTNLRWATRDNPGPHRAQAALRLREVHTVRHHGALPIDLIAAWDCAPVPSQVLVANVGGPDLAAHLTRACRSLWGLDPNFAVSRPKAFGVAVAYPEPERLGVDRWLALIAARSLDQRAALIVDAGTAITYDLLAADGTHLGGLILPGVHLLREALRSGTRIPPWAQPEEPSPTAPPWADNTATGIAAASLHAPSALAERLWERLRKRSDTPPRLILTGGDAERLAAFVQVPAQILPALVLQGLALLA
jgi:type III pantothenate kinase